ncbi:MAG TPA: SAM-dependent chlorinase/fluorinase [Ktedonobacteraceae bacterium]|nr:SAM-dependent chlorinase/fluorinase [Ktedonobacteraceae bacterium]
MEQQVVSSTQVRERPVVALMTDFGLGDGDVGAMKGVIAGIAPQAQILDITHDVSPQNVPSAAWILSSVYRYFPVGTVFVCVIDPGVGSSRGAIAVAAGDWFFVGPDNGLFSYVYAGQPIHGAALLHNPAYQLPQVSSTFHGRDIFAPAGAYLARGVDLREFGPAVEPAALLRLNIEPPARQGNVIEASVLHVDHFGNIITSIPLSLVPDLFDSEEVRAEFPGNRGNQAMVTERRRFFAGGAVDGVPFIYGDSSGYVGIAVRNGSAARVLNVSTSMPVILFIKNT